MRTMREAGFSMIELIVVIVIAALLLAWGYPRLATLAQKYRLDGAAWNLATDLQKVRLRAIQEGRNFQVIFDNAAKTYEVQRAASGGGWENGTVRAIEDAGTITLAANANPVFTTRGIVQGAGARIRMAAPTGGERTVWVQIQGQIYVQ